MLHPIGTGRRAAAIALVAVTALVVAACGSASSSSSDAGAQTLLKQTFSGSHTVKSGILNLNLTLTPSGSSTLKGPISLGLSGPFQTRGTGKLPASNFSVSANALGHTGTLGVVSTGANGYLTLQGAAYQLPAADYQKLATSFSSVGGSGGGTGGLSKLGIQPLRWLTNPSIVGNDTVGGTPTSHIRATVDVPALLRDFNAFLQKASASGAAGSTIPSAIPPSTLSTIAGAIKNPTVEIWTGTGDKTLRKLTINLNVPVSGQFSILLGGLSSAGVGMTLQYTNLNQPQTISAPGNLQPFSGFVTKLRSVLQQARGVFNGSGLASIGSGSSGSSDSGSSTSGAGNPANVQKYTQCIQKAVGDVTKMQKCAAVLSGG